MPLVPIVLLGIAVVQTGLSIKLYVDDKKFREQQFDFIKTSMQANDNLAKWGVAYTNLDKNETADK